MASPNFTAPLFFAARAQRLSDALSLSSPCTVFCPSDAAIRTYYHQDPDAVSFLDSEAGAAAVKAHCIPTQALTLDAFPPAADFTTAAGTQLHVELSKDGTTFIVTNKTLGPPYTATVLPSASDIRTEEGCMIHTIDAVLAPVTALPSPAMPTVPSPSPIPSFTPAQTRAEEAAMKNAAQEPAEASDLDPSLIPPPVGPSPMDVQLASLKLQGPEEAEGTLSPSAIAKECSWAQETLRRAGPGILGSDSCILFVPTDEALKQYCASNPPLSVAIMNPAIFARAIKGHMIERLPLMTSDIGQGQTPYTTASGLHIVVTKTGPSVTVSSPFAPSASIVTPNVTWKGNVLHTIDAVLEPLQVSEVEQQEGSTPQAPLPAPGPVPLSALDLTSDDLYDTSAEPAAAPVPRVATDADLDLATEVLRHVNMDLLHGTIFAPSHSAITRYAEVEPVAASMLTTAAGEDAIKAHVIPDIVLTLSSFPEGISQYVSLTGEKLVVTRSGDLLTVGTGSLPAQIIGGNILHGPNAIVHIVDLVLAPIGYLPSASEADDPQTSPSIPTSIRSSQEVTFAIQAAQLANAATEVLKRGGTFFMPSNSALSAHAAEIGGTQTAQHKLQTPGGLAAVKAHCAPGEDLTPASIPEGTTVHTSAAATPVIITKLAGSLAVACTFDEVTRTAKIVRTVALQGGLTMHVVDAVLAPLPL